MEEPGLEGVDRVCEVDGCYGQAVYEAYWGAELLYRYCHEHHAEALQEEADFLRILEESYTPAELEEA